MYYNLNTILWIKIRIWFQLQNMIHAVTTSGATPKSRVKYSTNFAKRARLRGPTSQKIRFKCKLHLKHWLDYSQFPGRLIFNWGCPKKFQAWKILFWLFGWDNKTLCIWFQNLVLGGIGILPIQGLKQNQFLSPYFVKESWQDLKVIVGDRVFTLDTDWSVAESPTSSKIHEEQVGFVWILKFGLVWNF